MCRRCRSGCYQDRCVRKRALLQAVHSVACTLTWWERIGMLANEENIRVVANAIRDYGIEKTVIDPVCAHVCWLASMQSQHISILSVKKEALPVSMSVGPLT